MKLHCTLTFIVSMFSSFYLTFKCSICNKSYSIISSKNVPFGTCVDYLCNNQFPNVSQSPCFIIYLLYTIKRHLSNKKYIDPFDYTYSFVNKLKQKSGYPFELVYDTNSDEDECDFAELINCLSINVCRTDSNI